MSHERSLPGVRLSSVVGASLALCLCLSAAAQADAAAPSTCPGVNVVVHGTLQFVDVEGGCWQFVTDGGAHYEPIGAGVAGMCEGQPGTLVGCTRPDLASICQVGEIVEVTSFTPDSTVVHGATEFVDVVGGCWRFVADDGTPYEPLGGPPELYVDGACGTLTFSAACGLGSTCQVGLLVNVLAFDGSAHWTDLGLGLSGNTTPTLGGDGTLCAGQPLTLTLAEAAPASTVWLVAGVARVDLPFMGGTLVPAFQAPAGLVLVLASDAGGDLVIAANWPTGVPSGLDLYLQGWVADAGGPFGFSASNAVVGTTP